MEHPARLLQRLGVQDRAAILVIVLTGVLQYVFLARLWDGYLFQYMDDVVHSNVVWTFASASVLAALAIIFYSLHLWTRSAVAARALEKEARHHSFDGIRQALAKIASRSTLREEPSLLYTPKNAVALEVRHGRDIPDASIVVGLAQRDHQLSEPEAFSAQLGHEVSHLELNSTSFEILFRRCVFLHVRVLAACVALFAFALGFIDRSGLGSDPAWAGFDPIFDADIYLGLIGQLQVLILSTTIIVVYSYFFLVRREHLHDIRGSQLARTAALAERTFNEAKDPARIRKACRDFFGLHPTAAARKRVIESKDIILLSVIVYPLVIVGLPPTLQLLTSGWQSALGIDRSLWTIGLTVFSGLAVFLTLSSDIARIGLSLVFRRLSLLALATYVTVAALATQIPRLILSFTYGLRRGNDISEILAQLIIGGWSGLITNGLLIALLLLALAYAKAVRIAAIGERLRPKIDMVQTMSFALVVSLAFVASISKSTALFVSAASIAVVVMLLSITVIVLRSRCRSCLAVPRNSLRLDSACQCGSEQLPELRAFYKQGYSDGARVAHEGQPSRDSQSV